MKNFILSAAVLVLAGLSSTQAGTTNNTNNTLFVQDTVKKDTVDTTKKDAPKFSLVVKKDTVQTPQDTTKKDTPKFSLAAL